jgi:hypothetical protein
MSETDAQLMLRRETCVVFGEAPHSLTDEPLAEMQWQMNGQQFLLRGVGHHYFHYSKGKGVTIERGPGADLSEESLWLNGSVHVAIASLNGLLPIHASAVAVAGQVFAFTGPGGAGKSTLVAALGDCGLPMFCDDTLVLDLSEPGRITCLPGHKRLKLRPDALRLTGASADEKVSLTVDKFYARPAAGDVHVQLPLAQLIFLEVGMEASVTSIQGAERFVSVQDDHYTATLFASAARLDRLGQFAHFSRLARQIDMARFARPVDEVHFRAGVELVAQYLKETADRRSVGYEACGR